MSIHTGICQAPQRRVSRNNAAMARTATETMVSEKADSETKYAKAAATAPASSTISKRPGLTWGAMTIRKALSESHRRSARAHELFVTATADHAGGFRIKQQNRCESPTPGTTHRLGLAHYSVPEVPGDRRGLSANTHQGIVAMGADHPDSPRVIKEHQGCPPASRAPHWFRMASCLIGFI